MGPIPCNGRKSNFHESSWTQFEHPQEGPLKLGWSSELSQVQVRGAGPLYPQSLDANWSRKEYDLGPKWFSSFETIP